MTNKKTASLLALTMLAMTLAPLTTAVPNGGEIVYATGPAGVIVQCGATAVPDPTDPGNPFATFCPQNRINNAIAFCQLVDSGIPTACEAGPGDVAGLGGAFFNTTSWNADSGAGASYGRLVNLWVKHIEGPIAGGFAAVACTDYNDDIECDSGNVGYADDDCPSKDIKNCGDPTDLSLTFCAEKDEYAFVFADDPTHVFYDRDYDDFVVFIESWIDLDKDVFDTGASEGTFAVHSAPGSYVNQANCDANNAFIVEHDPIVLAECEDGIDNDGDGFTDFPNDPGCDAPNDDVEAA